jgi:hypothetical protein
MYIVEELFAQDPHDAKLAADSRPVESAKSEQLFVRKG